MFSCRPPATQQTEARTTTPRRTPNERDAERGAERTRRLVDEIVDETRRRTPRETRRLRPLWEVAESGRQAYAQSCKLEGRTVGCVGCPPNWRTSGKSPTFLNVVHMVASLLHFGKIPNFLVKFGENSKFSRIWQVSNNFFRKF